MSTIEQNCEDTVGAKALHQTIGELLMAEVPQLPSDRSRGIFWDLMLGSVQKNAPPPPPQDPDTPDAPKKLRPTATSYTEAMSLVEEIQSLAGEICSAGQDFADSVLDKAESIAESVERSGSATDGQLDALTNMKEGLERWFHD